MRGSGPAGRATVGRSGWWMAGDGEAWRRLETPTSPIQLTVLRRDQLTWTVGAGSMHCGIRSSHAANLESGTEHKKEQWRLLVCLPKHARCFWGT